MHLDIFFYVAGTAYSVPLVTSLKVIAEITSVTEQMWSTLCAHTGQTSSRLLRMTCPLMNMVGTIGQEMEGGGGVLFQYYY